MTKITKAATSKPAAPAKAQMKNSAKASVGVPVVARATNPLKPAVAAQPAKASAKRKPPASVTRAQARAKSRPGVSPEQRRCYVEVAAYFIAERHGFTPGRDDEDWSAAEAEIDRMIADGMLRTE